ncbi:hypothetical protein [Micromonospora fulviviridis]|uniref:hypothetical protein n=1 Tax=Micromonospora fulviviridis TaxID=47860 RepID=UPI000D2817DC|nr:hypothetical protein [Micromonospora sp. MH33]PSK66785.1 hypothetical protein B0E53_01270 [Micromonospora sp. MH33]
MRERAAATASTTAIGTALPSHPDDRRVARLTLTDAARTRMADYAAHRSALLTEALATLDPPARDAILAAAPHLDALLDALRARP